MLWILLPTTFARSKLLGNSTRTPGHPYIESPRGPYPVYRHLQSQLQDIFLGLAAADPGDLPGGTHGPRRYAGYIIVCRRAPAAPLGSRRMHVLSDTPGVTIAN